MRRARMLLISLSLLVGLMLVPPAAQGAFHIMQIREVAPNPGSDPNSAYIELQMWTSGQNFVTGHILSYYDSTTADWEEFPFPRPAGNGGNQRTILIGASSSVGAAGSLVTPDFVWNGLSGLADESAGGAVCFENWDCVSWGGFGGATLSPTGTPGPAIGANQSLTRGIGRGCATALDGADDTNNSAADFTNRAPAPRNNSTAPSETPCTGPGPGDVRPPQTTITGHPPSRSRRRTARFRFRSSEGRSNFRCKLDGRPFSPCRSPRTYRNLKPGRHTFRVRAIDLAGNADRTPARFTFRVLR